MSSELAVEVQGLTKDYTIATTGEAPTTLREALSRRLHKPFERVPRSTFRALDRITFDVAPGEVIGIIGRNGAGKSTLLKLLSGVTDPSEGRAVVHGRMGSLLEVGTGFHPELTGRENIFLNGAILGMSRGEIGARFDEIVEFAGVAKFLETPVKRYSSGMYVRLAFSVAAHLEPEILVVDEVLAVGDADFQARCLGRMSDIAHGGRTVFFVSHSMPAILRLCTRVLLLEGGQLVRDGRPVEVVSKYLAGGGTASPAEQAWTSPEGAPGDDKVRLRGVRVIGHDGEVTDEIDIEHPFSVEVSWWDVSGRREAVTPHLHFRDDNDITLFVTFSADPVAPRDPDESGHPVGRARVHVPGNFLAEGHLFLLAGLATLSPAADHVYEPDIASFTVVDRMTGTSARGAFAKDLPGVIRPALEWTC